MLKNLKEKVKVSVFRVESYPEYKTTHHVYGRSPIFVRGAMNDVVLDKNKSFFYAGKGNYFFRRLYISDEPYPFTKQVYFYLERFNKYTALEYNIITKDEKAEKIALGNHTYENMMAFKYKSNLFKKPKLIYKHRNGRIVAPNCLYVKNIPYF